ncbi:MAG TPA: hypothetical protein VEH76_14660 [Methylocystis sp.]|nr:hypothetical protein [Methylocystis sp.]
MSIIPCKENPELKRKIEDFADVLKTKSHLLGEHGLEENEFYNSGLFRGAIERVRGQFAASMREKREFVRCILSYMEDRGFVKYFDSSGSQNRYDYTVEMPSGKVSVIELKGGLDGNNTIIFERPAHADELIIWSVSTNPGGDPRHNVWSGIHTRLSAEIIANAKRVDGLIVWDWACGTIGRPCPKLMENKDRLTTVSHYRLPPPCLYVFPDKIPEARNNPKAVAQSLRSVELLEAFRSCFGGTEAEVSYVDFEVAHLGAETVRKTVVRRDGVVIRSSDNTPIRRK